MAPAPQKEKNHTGHRQGQQQAHPHQLVWMCLLLALPVAGMILFLLWGGSHQAKSLSLRKVAPPVERESRCV